MSKKILCSNCIHAKVCGRIQFAKKYKEENDNSFHANSIADICQDYLESVDKRE